MRGVAGRGWGMRVFIAQVVRKVTNLQESSRVMWSQILQIDVRGLAGRGFARWWEKKMRRARGFADWGLWLEAWG